MPGEKTIVFAKGVHVRETLQSGGGTAIICERVKQGQSLPRVRNSEFSVGHGSPETRIQYDGDVTAKNAQIGQKYAVSVNYAKTGRSAEDEARDAFNARVQNEGENVEEYAQELRKLSENCRFSNLDEELLKQFIRGVRDHEIRSRLQRKGNISFDKATGIAEVMEEEKLARATEPKQH